VPYYFIQALAVEFLADVADATFAGFPLAELLVELLLEGGYIQSRCRLAARVLNPRISIAVRPLSEKG